ncbi:unnamed protein product [Bursaphelenchus okinawaensis]|uniref:PDZ domain-containing protein n=1 Tax=Bursaphelenchus okinawaensis TaxID=465554 RepID=A0A811LDJ1_9BILA|nr:unnamed protein product [Bursaphelenchus okinawaensis]CAG9123300.1 unnamed protein product [Bursaphelenchus okinawaensis]
MKKESVSVDDELKVSVDDEKKESNDAAKKPSDEEDVKVVGVSCSVENGVFSCTTDADKGFNVTNRLRDVFKFEMDKELFQVIDLTVDVEKLQLRLTGKGLVLTTEPPNGIKFADLIVQMEQEAVDSRSEFTRMLKTYMKQQKKQVKMRVVRLVFQLPVDPKRMPMGYDSPRGFTYLTGVMYRFPVLKMSLSIKSYMSKIFVCEAPEGTAAGLSLQQGDAVLDVNEVLVATVGETKKKIMDSIYNKGYVTMLIERPNDDAAFQFCRMVLNFKKTPPKDLGLAKDVRDICRKQRKLLKISDPQPERSILKEHSGVCIEPRRVKIANEATEIPISAQGNPKLLASVPPNATESLLSKLKVSSPDRSGERVQKTDNSSDSQVPNSPSNTSQQDMKRSRSFRSIGRNR